MGDQVDILDLLLDRQKQEMNSLGIFTKQPGAIYPEEIGYKVHRDGLVGIALLTHRNLGKDLVMRLKDRGADLGDEVGFWCDRLVELTSGVVEGHQIKTVTAPPSSKKKLTI